MLHRFVHGGALIRAARTNRWSVQRITTGPDCVSPSLCVGPLISGIMPNEQEFLARINIHISDEEGDQSNEDKKSESSEASSRHEVTNQNPSINESDSQIHNK